MIHVLRLNCISCGHAINLHEDVYADYEGLIKCETCAAVLHIKMQEGKLRGMEFVRIARPGAEET